MLVSRMGGRRQGGGFAPPRVGSLVGMQAPKQQEETC